MRKLHLEHSHELICEPKSSLLNRAMGQVLLPHIKSDPYGKPRKQEEVTPHDCFVGMFVGKLDVFLASCVCIQEWVL